MSEYQLNQKFNLIVEVPRYIIYSIGYYSHNFNISMTFCVHVNYWCCNIIGMKGVICKTLVMSAPTLRWMHEHINMDKNQFLRKRLGVTIIFAKMREIRLRYFIYVQRKLIDGLVKRVESIIGGGKGSHNRSKKTLKQQIKNDISKLRLSKELTKDKSLANVVLIS